MKEPRLVRDLREIPELYALLPVFLLPGTGSTGEGASGGHSAGSRPAASADVVDLLDRREKRDAVDPARSESVALDSQAWSWQDGQGHWIEEDGASRQGVLPTLHSWSRVVDADLWDAGIIHDEWGVEACTRTCEEAPARAQHLDTLGPCTGNPRTHWTTATVSGECAFLLEHQAWIRRQQWHRELEDDIHQLRASIRAVLRDPDPIELKCTQCGWSVESMDVDPKTGEATWYRCTGCPMTWSRAEVSRLYDRQQPLSLAECAELLGRPVKTLHHWRSKGWIKPVGRDHRGSLFSLSGVQDVAVSTVHGVKRDTP